MFKVFAPQSLSDTVTGIVPDLLCNKQEFLTQNIKIYPEELKLKELPFHMCKEHKKCKTFYQHLSVNC